ncbi:DUF3035 domain-containing protein [Paracoccus sp. (in: a-proteobacteria)]|uniref:DUF3035 domain-containing protein n=1 Tax=Paracoccus sp. TaxID=267 RepID=UPI003A87522C
MRAFALIFGMVALAGLTACSGSDRLTNLNAGSTSPDEFAILPTRPLSMPPDLAMLPAPTPGGSNITDPTPLADAVGALGGNPAALADSGISASDQALVAYASRAGNDPEIRARLALEDARWRSRHSRGPLEVMAHTDVYMRSYRPMALDAYAEQLRWQRAGARTPAAPAGPDEE